MNTTTEKIASIASSLPEDMRESFENHLLDDAEYLATALEAEADERYRKTMLGVEQANRGETVSIEEFEAHMDVFEKRLAKQDMAQQR